MKPYTYLLIVIVISATLFGACSTSKQVVSQSHNNASDTFAVNQPLPYYVPRLNQTIQPYRYNPKPVIVSTKDLYEQAYKDLRDMLEGKTEVSFERAVFISETPYHNGRFTYTAFQNSITGQLDFIQRMIAANDKSDTMDFNAYVNQYGRFELKDLRYLPKQKKELYRKALSNWAIFKFITDTAVLFSQKDSIIEIKQHIPYSYATADPFGMKDWRNSQVINLLMAEGNKGNCFALTALYKILSDRMNADAKICTAPQHIYIQHRNPKGQYFNVELATAGHPGDGIIQTLTHTPSDAIRSGIALRDYTAKQSIGLCLVNLAKSYEHQFNTKDNGFMLRCAELALRYDSLNLNAILLKAQVLDARVTNYATAHKIKTIEQLKGDKTIAPTVLQLEKHLARLGSLGYRQMPVDMQELIMNPLQYDPKKWDHKSRNPKPFTSIKVLDPKDEEIWSLTKGMFQEVFEPRAKETYGHFTVNHQTKQLVAMDTTTVKGFVIDPVAFAYDFGARMYDARVGHFVSIDPLANKYPSISPYAFVANNPIIYVDRDGKKINIYYTDANGKNVAYEYGSKQTVPDNEFVRKSIQALDYIKQAGVGQAPENAVNRIAASTSKTLNLVENSAGAYRTIFEADVTDKNGNTIPDQANANPADAQINSGTIPFNPYAALSDNSGTRTISPATGLAHEIGHAVGAFFNTKSFLQRSVIYDPQFEFLEERFATETFEHPVAKFGGEWMRRDHSSGKEIMTTSPTSNTPVVTSESQLGKGEAVEFKRKP